MLPSREPLSLSLARFVFSSFFSRDAYFARDGFILKSFHARTKRKENLHEERKRARARTAKINAPRKIKRGCIFQSPAGKKREERELSLAFTRLVRVHRRKHQSSLAQPKIKSKKKAHTTRTFFSLLLNFLRHKQTNKQLLSRSFGSQEEKLYIYIYKEREREKGYPPRCALIFLLVIRRETRDKFRIFFFFSEPPPPRKNKRKSASRRRRRRRRRARREKNFFGGIKNDV